jgi:lipoprotein-anchoring transpeptidase ErfK/SrfK
MGISAPGVGIHGTNNDASIGYSVSHGCIRMHVSDAEWLFNHVAIGTPVFIVSA